MACKPDGHRMAVKSTPEERKLKKHLKDLTTLVGSFSNHMDKLMKTMPRDSSSPIEREAWGKRVAAAMNSLDLANDQARYFGLGLDYRTDKKDFPVMKETPNAVEI